MPKTKRADELEEGDIVLQRVASIGRTATGYVSFYQSTGPDGSGRLQVVPPDTLLTVAI